MSESKDTETITDGLKDLSMEEKICDGEILYEDYKLFYNTYSRSSNADKNNKREAIIKAIFNDKIPKKWLENPKWIYIYDVKDVILSIIDDHVKKNSIKYNKIDFKSIGGRKECDFKINFYNTKNQLINSLNIEFKYNKNSIQACSQFKEQSENSYINQETDYNIKKYKLFLLELQKYIPDVLIKVIEQYLYRSKRDMHKNSYATHYKVNYIPSIIKKFNIPIIFNENTWIKTVYKQGSKKDNDTFIYWLYKNKQNNPELEEFVNKSVDESINEYMQKIKEDNTIIDIPFINKYLKTFTNKPFILFKNNKWYSDSFSENELICTDIHSVIHNAIILNTKSSSKICINLRWANGKGIQNISWKFYLKR